MPISRSRILILSFFLLLLSCEKELSMDYRTVSPIYVTEASLTLNRATAHISTTRAVSDNVRTNIDDAVITISMDGSDISDTLRSRGNGLYDCRFRGMPGHSFTIDVYIDGHHHTSSSAMRSAPQMKSMAFVWSEVMGQRILFGDLRLDDIPNENNYYFMHLYRNGVGYRWAVMRDTSNPGGELQQLFSCCTERDMNKGTGNDVLHEGDRMKMEIRSVDKTAFDYLYSLQLMDNTGTNPIANFSGGMLGYFSAYQSVSWEAVFSVDSIR